MQRIAVYFVSSFLIPLLFATADATAQTIAYRQTNLASSLPAQANGVAPGMADPWGIAFLSGQPFFIADRQTGRVTVLDATGFGAVPGGFAIPNALGNGFDHPTGITADQNSSFGNPSLLSPFILVTSDGTAFTWGPDARGDLPSSATRVIDSSARGAVYEGVAILNSSLTPPVLAITDFHGGFIDTFLPGFVPVALPGSFADPNLPAGYAPFGIQVLGTQVFVTYALQDAAQHDPVPGAGNGLVSIFDMDGNFLRRFVTGGALNAPWGIALAGSNFGPFSNDILIANVGDGTINAFDPASGRLVGPLLDGDGLPIIEIGLHALAFRADGFGDPNTLYFASQLSGDNDGLFGALTPGLVDTTLVNAPATSASEAVTITASVVAGPGNSGAPTGTVTFLDGTNQLGISTLVGGQAVVTVTLAGIGVHPIGAEYSGDATFLPSRARIPLQVNGFATSATLSAPANAAPGSSVVLTATIASAGGIPTGQAVFLDGNLNLGSAPLNDAGMAILRIDTLSLGAHQLSVSYAGDEKFAGSASPAIGIEIANPDFTLEVNPSAAILAAGQSTQFILTVTPAGGFASDVAFSCSPGAGISCGFNPATLHPANGAATTTLTVTTSASVALYGLLPVGRSALVFLALVALWTFPFKSGGNFGTHRPSLVATAASLMLLTLGLAIGGCGGYGSGAPSNRRVASITVTAQSGNIAHTATVNLNVQ